MSFGTFDSPSQPVQQQQATQQTNGTAADDDWDFSNGAQTNGNTDNGNWDPFAGGGGDGNNSTQQNNGQQQQQQQHQQSAQQNGGDDLGWNGMYIELYYNTVYRKEYDGVYSMRFCVYY